MRSIITNPIKLFAFIVILLSLILLIGCQFHCPDIYLNRELVEKLYDEGQRYYSFNMYFNKSYYFYNSIFQLWSFGLTALIFTLIFKITEFKKFKELKLFNNKFFAYFWVNISYYFLTILYVNVLYDDYSQYIENFEIDSPDFLGLFFIFLFFLIGIAYYPIANLLTYITLNTNIKRNFYNFVWIILFITLLASLIFSFVQHYTKQNILLDFIYIVWFVYIINSLRFLKDKKQEIFENKNKYLISKGDILIYIIIAIFCSTLTFFLSKTKYSPIKVILTDFTYLIPAILAIIINLIIKYCNINERRIKIIKVIFNIFALIYIVVMTIHSVITNELFNYLIK